LSSCLLQRGQSLAGRVGARKPPPRRRAETEPARIAYSAHDPAQLPTPAGRSGEGRLRRSSDMRLTIALLLGLLATPGLAGDAEIQSAQTAIDRQLKAFQSNDGATAYSFAAPS